MHIDAAASAAFICNDLPWELAYEHVLQFPHHSAASFLEPVTQIAYKDVPVSYIVCEKDMIIAPDAQREFVKVLEEASLGKVHVVSLESGHCPNWSVPEKLAEVIVVEAARA
jgi:pimeloyl-ACP methyl ester carboxylesterase